MCSNVVLLSHKGRITKSNKFIKLAVLFWMPVDTWTSRRILCSDFFKMAQHTILWWKLVMQVLLNRHFVVLWKIHRVIFHIELIIFYDIRVSHAGLSLCLIFFTAAHQGLSHTHTLRPFLSGVLTEDACIEAILCDQTEKYFYTWNLGWNEFSS